MFTLFAFIGFLVSSTAFPPHFDGRIVGGDDATISDFPYQLSVQTEEQHFCGASILSSKWALTAAHCTNEMDVAQLTVVAGISNLKETGQRINIAKVHQSPVFNTKDLDEDIALLELESEIIFNANAHPITLAAEGNKLSVGTDVVITGWGTLYSGGNISDQLKKVTVQVIDHSRCAAAYNSTVKITENMICAGVSEGGRDSCQCDSGGPMVANGKLVGIISFGVGCADPTYPGVYANIGTLRSFIKDVSGI